MPYIEFDKERALDVIPLGRIAIDFNPIDYFKPWPQCETFKKYVGGSPANIAVGMSRLGKKSGFIGCVSDDQMGDYCIQYFEGEGIDTSHVMRARHGESLGLAFTEILDRDTSSLIMYRDNVADLSLEPEWVDEAYIKSARMLVVSGTALARSPSREAALKAMELARKTAPWWCSTSTTGRTPGETPTRLRCTTPRRPGRRTLSWAPARSTT